MTGYWRDLIDAGHKTGPHRTSIQAVRQYEQAYADPFGCLSYRTSGFAKKNGHVTAQPTMVSPENIAGLDNITAAGSDNRDRLSPLFATSDELRTYLKANVLEGRGNWVSIQKLLAGNTVRRNGEDAAIHVYVSPENMNRSLFHGSTRSGARGMPVLHNGVVKWIGIYRPAAS
jgi:hypothetical protein